MRGPNESSSESSTSIIAWFLPAFVCATPGSLSKPDTPPTDSNPFVITRIRSGFSVAKLSAVIVLKGRGSEAAPTSIAPIAEIKESAPDPAPPTK